MRVFHCAAYKCTTVFSMGQHDTPQTKRCRNSKVSTHIVEAKVLEMIQDVMFDADKFGRCIDNRHAAEDRGAARKLTQISVGMNHLDDQRRCLIERYVKRELPSQEYIEASRALDARQESLTRGKTEIIERMRVQGLREDVAASVRRFCATARAQFEGCTDFASKRQFLRDHIEAVIFDHGRITVVGSVNDLKLPFRIEGQIDRASIRLNSSQKANEAPRRARTRPIVTDPTEEWPSSRHPTDEADAIASRLIGSTPHRNRAPGQHDPRETTIKNAPVLHNRPCPMSLGVLVANLGAQKHDETRASPTATQGAWRLRKPRPCKIKR
jgi:hypothetical protein